MSTLFSKGTFKPIDTCFMTEAMTALDSLSDVQNKYQKGDIDNFLNELHDSVVGHYLGFNLINIEKHGFDCKLDNDKDVFLESKVASISAGTWSATFNDTTLEKANAFKNPNVWLALSVWLDASKLLFICYGQHPGIGDFLEERVTSFLGGHGIRSTQTISFSKLIKDFGFRILSISKTPQELISFLALKSREFPKYIKPNIIDTLPFDGITIKQ